ncbi:MAG: C40 family peptidase [Parachlamydiaceae bacterium]|nr:C40 family peptidase [Parachlamydiaceae bacterium]
MSLFLLTLMFTYVNAPFVEMREGPSLDTKVDSQAIYAERVEILETAHDWIKIQTPDTYTGWVKKDLLRTQDYPFIDHTGALTAMINRRSAHIYAEPDLAMGPMMTLPYESRLQVIDQMGNPEGRWLCVQLVNGQNAYVQRGDIMLNPKPLNHEELTSLSLNFMDLPYTWGGRVSFGYDCSGFTQMLYRRIGVILPRNARQQINWNGFHEVATESLQPGDLIFFGKDSSKIVHVGLFLGDNWFIHASQSENKPYIRLNNLTEARWNGTEGSPFPFRTARGIRG